jgi:hypothetical protein
LRADEVFVVAVDRRFAPRAKRCRLNPATSVIDRGILERFRLGGDD